MTDEFNRNDDHEAPSAPEPRYTRDLDPLPDLGDSAVAPIAQTPPPVVPVIPPPAAVDTDPIGEPVAPATPSPAAPVTPPPPSPAPVRRGCGCGTFLVGLSGALIGAALGTFILLNLIGVGPDTVAQRIESPQRGDVVVEQPGTVVPSTPQPRTDLETAEQVAEKVVPSVVNVSIETSFFDPRTGRSRNQSAGNGSGVIMDTAGHILTNAHVVAGAQNLFVTVGNKDYPAAVVGTDPSSDIAVLKIDASGLTPIDVGDSGAVRVGQWVMAVGSPFGLEKSVTTGIVSALKRSETMAMETGSSVYSNMIQVDAAINPGNSGGALVDAEGALIGVPTLIQSTSGQSAGVGFAIPVNYAMEIASQLIENGTAVHPFLGVSVQTLDPGLAGEYGLSVGKGAYIASIEPGTAADVGGLEVGDVVIDIAGARIDSADDLLVEIRTHRPGDEIDIVVHRAGEEITVPVTLGSDTR